MKKIFVCMLGILFSFPVYSQLTYTEAELKQKCDSILKESDLLYRSEAASWNFTDLFYHDTEFMKLFNGYLTYQQGDTIKCIVKDKQNECILEAAFLKESAPCYTSRTKRSLSAYELELLTARQNIWADLSKKKIGIDTYQGFNPNWILIPFEDGYKFYVICGATKSQIVPFGNDYLFIANKKGEVQSCRKFHSRIIPIELPADVKMMGHSTHSHLPQEPLISATDICTFRLYYDQIGSTSFTVYSPALSIYFIYELSTHSITISKTPTLKKENREIDLL